jgi:hypothetical protein
MKTALLITLLLASPGLAHPERHVDRQRHERYHPKERGAFHRDGTRRQFYDLDGTGRDANGRRCVECRTRYYREDTGPDVGYEEDSD